jgi:soluble lytic murein transglycosylase-like protein
MEAKRSAFPEARCEVVRQRPEKALAKTRTMNKNCIPVAVLVAGAFFALSSPLRAQIATQVDEHGKLVFVNGDSPNARRGSTISPTAGGPHSRSALSAESAAETLGANDGRLDRIVRDAAVRHQVDPALVKAVISTESGWNPQAVSRKGAVGLMQLIPGTAQRFGVGNPFDPAQNVEGGTTYLKALLDRYNGDLSKTLAAYNAGEHAVDANRGVPPYWETQRYVQKVQDAYFRPGSGRDSTLWTPPRNPVRKEVDSNGRVIFTNE